MSDDKRIKWSTAELDTLRDLYPVKSTKEVAKAMGKSDRQIRSKATALNLKKKSFYWTKKDIAYLNKHWGEESAQEIADTLGKTRDAVYIKRKELKNNAPA